jgi:hypothetical protein
MPPPLRVLRISEEEHITHGKEVLHFQLGVRSCGPSSILLAADELCVADAEGVRAQNRQEFRRSRQNARD